MVSEGLDLHFEAGLQLSYLTRFLPVRFGEDFTPYEMDSALLKTLKNIGTTYCGE